MQEFIEQIVQEIISGARALDPDRRRMFLVWLGDHASQIVCAGETEDVEGLAQKLAPWLESLSVAGILWEYRLMASEIEWWSGLEQVPLERMGKKAGRNRSTTSIVLGLLLVALAALFVLCLQVQVLLPDFQVRLAIQQLGSFWAVSR